MTLFLIALIIFIVYTTYESAKRTEKFNNRKKATTSNAKEQYLIACNIIEEMADAYRYYASKMDADKYFDLKANQRRSIYQKPLKINKWYAESQDYLRRYIGSEFYFKYIVNEGVKERWVLNCFEDYERMWLISAGMLLGADLEDNRISAIVYDSKLWENLPKDISAITLKSWKEQYPNFIGSKIKLVKYLKIANKAKEILQCGFKEREWNTIPCDNAYWQYNVSSILEQVAQDYGLPINQELKTMHASAFNSYENLAGLAILYSRRAIKRKGYCPVSLNKIKVNPSAELIQRASGIKTKSEKWLEDIETKKKLMDKYPDIQ